MSSSDDKLEVGPWDGDWMEKLISHGVEQLHASRTIGNLMGLAIVLAGMQVRIIREISKIKKELNK